MKIKFNPVLLPTQNLLKILLSIKRTRKGLEVFCWV